MRFINAAKYLEALKAFKSHRWKKIRKSTYICIKCGYCVNLKLIPQPIIEDHKSLLVDRFQNQVTGEVYIAIPLCDDICGINYIYDIDIYKHIKGL